MHEFDLIKEYISNKGITVYESIDTYFHLKYYWYIDNYLFEMTDGRVATHIQRYTRCLTCPHDAKKIWAALATDIQATEQDLTILYRLNICLSDPQWFDDFERFLYPDSILVI